MEKRARAGSVSTAHSFLNLHEWHRDSDDIETLRHYQRHWWHRRPRDTSQSWLCQHCTLLYKSPWMTSRFWWHRDTETLSETLMTSETRRHEPELALSALHTPYCERRKQTARQSRFKSTYAQSCSEKKIHFLDYSNKNVVLWQKLRICKDSSPHKELICAVCHSVLYSSVCLSFIIKLKQPTSYWESRVAILSRSLSLPSPPDCYVIRSDSTDTRTWLLTWCQTREVKMNNWTSYKRWKMDPVSISVEWKAENWRHEANEACRMQEAPHWCYVTLIMLSR